LHIVFGLLLHATPQPPQLNGSLSGSTQVVPQHESPLGHVPASEHGPPPLSGTATSAPPSVPPLEEPPELPPDDPLEPPLDDPLPPLLLLLEDEPLLEPDPPDDPPEPDSADASEPAGVLADPPQPSVEERQNRVVPSTPAYFK
jgi:hypothetical protein